MQINIKKIFFMLLLLSIGIIAHSQNIKKTDTNIYGHVVSQGEHLAYVSISIKGTTIGTVTDATGHYKLYEVPVGRITIIANFIGYKTQEITIETVKGKSFEVDFDLELDQFRLDEVVITGNKNIEKRGNIPVLVTNISERILTITQSNNIGEGLNYCPGLRLENNCQNCGFTQVRMNGLEGAYSQILINGRPIFSGLAGVYGLELIPANMIQKMEILRGGGSALYGSNAIAGTINLILKEAINNSFEINTNTSIVGLGFKNIKPSIDYSIGVNTSLVSDDNKTGFTLYGCSKHRDFFDANNDGFSEISPINNLTLGGRLYQRLGSKSKLSLDFFNIKEDRHGGNKLNTIIHERDISETVVHNLKTAAISYDRYFREEDLLTAFVAGQFLDRDSYYGANQSLKDYGKTKDRTFNLGIQYKSVLSNTSSIIAGFDNTRAFLNDTKLGYPDFENATINNDTIVSVPHVGCTTIANQQSIIYGSFAQYELKLSKFKIYVGARFDNYNVKNKALNTEQKGNVFSPRLNFMFDITNNIKFRTGYSQGYRSPQIFDEDLHIETSGSRQVIHINDANLKQETSNSINASIDINKQIDNLYASFLLETFYTKINNPFTNEIGLPDSTGIVIYTRKNAENGAIVKGINLEIKLNIINKLYFNLGYTLQDSKYIETQQFNEKRFFRTPNYYGFITIDYNINPRFDISISGNHTGSMLVPYFGPNTDPEIGELKQSQSFFDMGTKLQYKFKINTSFLSMYIGVKNILNSYQKDFDIGINRDPSYIYGPLNPRTIYCGLKLNI